VHTYKLVKRKDLDLVMKDQVNERMFTLRRKFLMLAFTCLTYEWFSIIGTDEIKVALFSLLQSSISSIYCHCPCGFSSTMVNLTGHLRLYHIKVETYKRESVQQIKQNPEVFLPRRDPTNESYQIGSASEQRQRLLELERIMSDMYH
jgi:hypothetical protein